MRTRNAYRNFISGILLHIVTAGYGILIPQLFIREYGSTINGLVSMLTQLISCLGIVEMGLGAAGMVELYEPLARRDTQEINSILVDLGRFYRRSGIVFSAILACAYVVYPYIIRDDIPDISYVRIMMLILSVNTLSDFFILDRYRVLLMAAQKTYIINLSQVVSKIVITAAAFFLIRMGKSALVVKLSAVPVLFLASIAVIAITRKQYPFLDFSADTRAHAFPQRKAAFIHQISGMVCLNTDMVLLSVLSPAGALRSVSIYAVYDFVMYAVSSLVSAVTNGTMAGFGQLIADDEKEKLDRAYSSYEYAVFMFIFILLICTSVLIRPFMKLYTNGIPEQEEYIDSSIAALFIISSFARILRFPANTLIDAGGHYKNTQLRSIAESVINIVVSVALIPRYGIYGTLIGTIAAFLYRTVDVILYTAGVWLKGSLPRTFRRLCVNGLVSLTTIYCLINLISLPCDNWVEWIRNAIITAAISVISIAAANAISEKNEMNNLLLRIKVLFGRKGLF